MAAGAATTDSRIQVVRKALWLAGALLLGGALAYAPIAAFIDDMLTVTKVGLLGAALLLVARLMPRAAERPPSERSGDEGPRG